MLFYGTILPTGLVMRAMGKDLLRLKRDPDADSYWIVRQPPGPAPEIDERSVLRDSTWISVAELWRFLRVRKKFWLLPILVMMVLFGGLIVLTKGSAVAPFIYTLF